MNQTKIIAVCGVSGSGKSVLSDNLSEQFPQYFTKVDQVSTRLPRFEGENSYTFINDEQYDTIKDSLIATTEVNGKRYGTVVPDTDSDRLHLIIVNELGLSNLKADLESRSDTILAATIGLDRDYNVDALDETRSDRRHLLEEERKVIRHADLTWDCTNNNFPSVDEVTDAILEFTNDL